MASVFFTRDGRTHPRSKVQRRSWQPILESQGTVTSAGERDAHRLILIFCGIMAVPAKVDLFAAWRNEFGPAPVVVTPMFSDFSVFHRVQRRRFLRCDFLMRRLCCIWFVFLLLLLQRHKQRASTACRDCLRITNIYRVQGPRHSGGKKKSTYTYVRLLAARRGGASVCQTQLRRSTYCVAAVLGRAVCHGDLV